MRCLVLLACSSTLYSSCAKDVDSLFVWNLVVIVVTLFVTNSFENRPGLVVSDCPSMASRVLNVVILSLVVRVLSVPWDVASDLSVVRHVFMVFCVMLASTGRLCRCSR